MTVYAFLRHYWFAGALFVAALLPRLVALGRYITPDELGWVYRSILFREALLHGNWSETLTAGHPGVITTWLGGLALSVQLLLRPGDAGAYEFATKLAWLSPDNATAFEQLATFLSGGRIAVAIVTSLGIVAMLPLISRLYSRPVAVLACLLMALDPFLLGLSGLLHVDALMTTFVTVSLLALALLVKSGAESSRRITALAGVTAALAILTKSPALLLLPVTALAFALALVVPLPRPDRQIRTTLGHTFRPLVRNALVWLAAFMFTLVILLPALWATPRNVVRLTGGNAGRHLEEALRPTFFLGEAAFEHGWLFYPLTQALRMSPVVFAGLILGVVLALYYALRQRKWPRPWTWLLVVWVVLFLVGISLAAKKFDRYALPVVPSLILLAALAWQQLRTLLYRGREAPIGSFNAGAILLVVLQGLFLAGYLPYPLAAYNPLLGGPQVAEQLITVGWGEGVSAAGHWLNQQPDNIDRRAAADSLPSLAPFYPGRGMPASEEGIPGADFVIWTAAGRQLNPDAYEQTAASAPLLHTVQFGGLEQAWIFAGPGGQEAGAALLDAPYTFAGEVELQGQTVQVAEERVLVDLRWGLRDRRRDRYDVRLAVQDVAGETWSALETPLLNEVYFFPPDWQPDETPEIRYSLALPPGMPPDEYQVSISLFDSESGAQLPLQTDGGMPVGTAFVSDPFAVDIPVQVVEGDSVTPAVAVGREWRSDSIVLLGHELLPGGVATGDNLALDLTWHSPTGVPEDLLVRFQLGEMEPNTFPLSRYPTGQWRAGETVREKYRLPVLTDWPAGLYPLSVAVCRDESDANCEAYTLGEVEVYAIDRLFELPDEIPVPLVVSLKGRAGDEVVLHGARFDSLNIAPGDVLHLVLYWQATDRPSDLYTAFVHVVGPEGANITQQDQWPGGLPSNTWAAGQVIVDEYVLEIPVEAASGQYAIAVGLYTAADGVRLEMRGPGGEPVPDNRLLLPLVLEVR